MAKFTVVGVSDRSECECCGKTNLKRTICLVDEAGAQVFFGVDCASRSLRQVYMGKKYGVSREAVISMAKRASAGECQTVLVAVPKQAKRK